MNNLPEPIKDLSYFLGVKEADIKDYMNKLNLIDTELQSLKLEIAKLEVKKIESLGVRKQASHVLRRLEIEYDALKRDYFRQLRENP